MRPRTSLVYVLAVLCLGMGRPSLGIVNPSPSGGEHHPRLRSCLISLRYRQELHRRVRLLARWSARPLPSSQARSTPRFPTTNETAALSRPAGAVQLQLLMVLQE